MRINKKNYKSLNFTLLKEKLLVQSKTQTYRVLFIPKFVKGEVIAITYKEKPENEKNEKKQKNQKSEESKEEEEKEFLYFAKVTDLYPKQIKNISLKEARKDGFETIQAMQKAVMKLNNIKSMEQWGFIICFKKIVVLEDFMK